MIIDPNQTFVVMGLLDSDSIAWHIGEALRARGARVRYTMLNGVIKRRFLDRDPALDADWLAGLDYRFCDVTQPEEVEALFADIDDLGGVVHSVAYANPRTCLGEPFDASAIADIQQSYHISSLSLATVARFAVPRMRQGGGIVALTFDSQHAYPLYNWMGVHKAALDAVVRALARNYGRDGIRVNAVASGPVQTKAAGGIPGFDTLIRHWQAKSPLYWDPETAKSAVADAAVFLLSPAARLISGQILPVDGGVSAMGAELMPFERPSAPGEQAGQLR